MSNVIIGTELVLNIEVASIGADELVMDDYDFDITLMSLAYQKKKLVFEKRNKPTENNYSCSVGLKKSDQNTGYNVAFNTSDLGLGKLVYQVRAYLPDGAFDFSANDRKRTVIDEGETGVVITKSIM